MNKCINLFVEIINDNELSDCLKEFNYTLRIKKLLRKYEEESVLSAILSCETYLEDYWCERNKEIYVTPTAKVKHYMKMIEGTLYNRKYKTIVQLARQRREREK